MKRSPLRKKRIAWNKGTKGICKPNSGSFSKGNVPHNYGVKLNEDWKNKLSQAKIGKKRKPFTAKTIKKMKQAQRGENNYWFGKIPQNLMTEGKFGNVKRGWYKIGAKKMFFRSKWEANYALYLNFLIKCKQIKKWEYEADVFVFEKIKFGSRSYRPDFKVTNNNDSIEYHEVKGWMTPQSKTKIKRMAKYYPKVELAIIDGKYYTNIKRKFGKMLNFY